MSCAFYVKEIQDLAETYCPGSWRVLGLSNVLYAVVCVAVCCSVLQCGAVCCSVVQCGAVWCSVLQCGAVWCSVVQCVAVCCSVLQCIGAYQG